MYRICTECIKDRTLQTLVNLEGVDGEVCSVCGGTHKSIDTLNNRYCQLFKALIRFYYSEWDYNTHWGGDSLEMLFYKENPILNYNSTIDELKLEEVLLSTWDNVYEEYDKGVTLFAGYDENGQPAGILRALKDEVAHELVSIERRLENENYFNVENDLLDLLKPYVGIIDNKISTESSIYRARIGFRDIKREAPAGFELEYSYIPYSNSEIGAPPPRIAKGGRINREGVSFFYGATDSHTSVAEVRPHPGDKVSIGKFKIKEEIKVADFTKNILLHFFESDKKLDEEFIFINSINTYLNRTVPPSFRLYYSITQLIADCLRQLGYQGVKFRSSVGVGDNITIFYPELAVFTPEENEVYEIKSVNYEFFKLKIATP